MIAPVLVYLAAAADPHLRTAGDASTPNHPMTLLERRNIAARAALGLGEEADADVDVPAEETKVRTTTDGIPAIMLAPQYLYDTKGPSLTELGFVPKHVMPVISPLTCVHGSKTMTGCYLAHMNAWDYINRTKQFSLIIEADWTTAKRSFPDTRKLLNDVLQKYNNGNRDLISVGGCTQFGIPHVCTTAYFMTPEGADKMLRLSAGEDGGRALCPYGEPLDDTFRVLCTHVDEKTQTTKLKCYEAPNAPDLGHSSKLGENKEGQWQNAYGQGIFQQDRVTLRGMHVKGNDANSAKEAEKFHDTYDTPDAVS